MKNDKGDLNSKISLSIHIFKNQTPNMINTVISMIAIDHGCTVPRANGVNIKRKVMPLSIIVFRMVVFFEVMVNSLD